MCRLYDGRDAQGKGVEVMKLEIRFIGKMGIVEYEEGTWSGFVIEDGFVKVTDGFKTIGMYNVRYILSIQKIPTELEGDPA